MRAAINTNGGWLGFDDFLNIALHDPQHGYYGSGNVRFGSGGDFYTAPTISPLFAHTLARLMATTLGGGDVLELGAGDGTLAAQLLHALPPDAYRHYVILETSAALAARQRERLRDNPRVRWITALPPQHDGFIIANEVLDCVPFRLLVRQGNRWRERGVAAAKSDTAEDGALTFAVRDIQDGAADYLDDMPPADNLPEGYESEFSPQAAALAETLAACLQRGYLLFADYGFGRAEYYHPQRTKGTLMCHRNQRVEQADNAPLEQVGEKDITAHVDFTAIAEAGLRGGAALAGYVTQAQGLINSGITELLAAHPGSADGSGDYFRTAAEAHKLLAPHEMGELIKWMGFSKGAPPPLPTFSQGDMSHRL